ncbi:hypothetical protein ACMATS_06980 [Streptoverticillium reticulum]|uniref:hypothetical protein n=1 Tax=Streptoverticillium reticulum TaxID=1433415 RepID=UPI0039BF39F1
MYHPSLPTAAWWAISIATTVAFLAYFVPLMETRRQKIKTALAPLEMMAIGAALTLVGYLGVNEVYPIYCAALLAILLMCVGRRKAVKTAFHGRGQGGAQQYGRPTAGMYVQMLLSTGVMVALAIWVS